MTAFKYQAASFALSALLVMTTGPVAAQDSTDIDRAYQEEQQALPLGVHAVPDNLVAMQAKALAPRLLSFTYKDVEARLSATRPLFINQAAFEGFVTSIRDVAQQLVRQQKGMMLRVEQDAEMQVQQLPPKGDEADPLANAAGWQVNLPAVMSIGNADGIQDNKITLQMELRRVPFLTNPHGFELQAVTIAARTTPSAAPPSSE